MKKTNVSTRRPFADGSSAWSWPEEKRPERKRFEFEFEGATFVLRVPEPIRHSPDLRALTVFEAADLGKLKNGAKPERVRIELGHMWPEREATRLATRAAFLGDRLGIPTSVHWARQRGMPPDPIASADPVGRHTAFRPGAVKTIAASSGTVDFEDLSTALDKWLDLAKAAAAHAPDTGAEAPVVPIIVLKSPTDRIHPRIHWIARKLREAGIRIETPDPEDVPTTRFVSRIFDACLQFRHGLKVKGNGKYRGVEYEHILPKPQRRFALWEPLQDDLEAGVIMPKQVIHDGLGNLKSSQAFAVNLFAGLKAAGLLAEAVAEAFGTGPLQNVTVQFEYWDEHFKRFIGESEHQTQVDVLIRAMDGAMLRVFLIEVKLTEPYFGRCRGPYSKENRATQVCGVATPEDRTASCYLRKEKARRYLELASVAFPAIVTELGGDNGCPIRLDGYQLARNLAIRSWLAGHLRGPEVPPVPDHFHAPPGGSVDVRFAVVSANETPALGSEVLSRLGTTPQERLRKLGVEWVDAGTLLQAVEGNPKARELSAYLKARYPPVFA